MSIGIVDEQYHKIGLAHRVNLDFLNNHPFARLATTVYVDCEGFPAQRICERAGFEKILSIPYEKLAKKKGLKEFKYFKERLAAKDIDPKYYVDYCIYALERNNTRPKL
mmetsp:Transcript_7083/g.6334  ORF Transcript_7083/g.6334 Transcript_7083/m.6334 type:complete len:109 (-) Transcript_7083:205-531(-)